MKLSTKITLSPGRTEKYPAAPPLMMRFLRGNAGSRSRGRSRSSPMFLRKRINTTAIETQEPTSPKVTCMGQVRVRSSNTRPEKSIPKRLRCNWVHKNARFFQFFSGKLKSFSLKPAWEKWVSFFDCHINRKVKKDSKIEHGSEGFKLEIEKKEEDDDDSDSEEPSQAKIGAFDFVSPPKNALLLTRSRSAPYRSSSLAVRFWGSPLNTEDTERKQNETGQVNKEEEEDDDVNDNDNENDDEDDNDNDNNESRGSKVVLEVESVKKEPSDQEPTQLGRSDSSEGEAKSVFFKELEDPIVSTNEKIDQLIRTSSTGPLMLTRSKSEPARAGEKIEPQMMSLSKRRLGFT